MLHRQSGCLVFVTVFALGCSSDDANSRCVSTPIGWSEPRTVWSMPFGSVLFNPTNALIHSDTLFAIGEHSGPVDSLNKQGGVPLFGMKVSLNAIERPVMIAPPLRGGRLVHPLLAVKPNDLTVVWGETAHDSTGAIDQSAGVRTLWTATFAGDRWTGLEQIAHEESIRWNGVSASQLLAAPDGSLHLAVPASPRSGAGGILYLTRRGDRWRTTYVPVKGSEVAYAALEVVDDQVLLAYVAPIVGERDLNSVWFTSSADEGASWRTAELISRSGQRAATDLRIVATATTVTLVWGQNYGGGLATDAIRIVSASHGATHWIPPADLHTPRKPDQLRAAVGAVSGSTYVLYSQTEGGLATARWCNGAWSSVTRAPSDRHVPGSGTLVASDQGVFALWSDVAVRDTVALLRWRLARLQ